VRERLPVVVIVLNNALLGYQKHAEERQFSTATTAVDITPVDHAAIATACGAHGETITDPARLAERLTAALASDRPVLLDVITDPTAFPPLTGW
jgi:acetolactate synthase-1/2/3 large subunit